MVLFFDLVFLLSLNFHSWYQ